jgi:hypothetical protein
VAYVSVDVQAGDCFFRIVHAVRNIDCETQSPPEHVVRSRLPCSVCYRGDWRSQVCTAEVKGTNECAAPPTRLCGIMPLPSFSALEIIAAVVVKLTASLRSSDYFVRPTVNTA